MTSQSLEICILAAGFSTRLGSPKQLLSYLNVPLVRHAAQTALALPEASLSVILNDRVDCRAVLDGLPLTRIINPEASRGIGSSIKSAVQYAQDLGRDACLLMLSDQPLIPTAHLEAISDAWQVHPHSIIATAYPEGGEGIPALFPRCFYPDLLAIKDHAGAKEIIKAARDRILISLDPSTLLDIDTPQDVALLREREAKPSLE